jgi:hypothetical protein
MEFKLDCPSDTKYPFNFPNTKQRVKLYEPSINDKNLMMTKTINLNFILITCHFSVVCFHYLFCWILLNFYKNGDQCTKESLLTGRWLFRRNIHWLRNAWMIKRSSVSSLFWIQKGMQIPQSLPQCGVESTQNSSKNYDL